MCFQEKLYFAHTVLCVNPYIRLQNKDQLSWDQQTLTPQKNLQNDHFWSSSYFLFVFSLQAQQSISAGLFHMQT